MYTTDQGIRIVQLYSIYTLPRVSANILQWVGLFHVVPVTWHTMYLVYGACFSSIVISGTSGGGCTIYLFILPSSRQCAGRYSFKMKKLT